MSEVKYTQLGQECILVESLSEERHVIRFIYESQDDQWYSGEVVHTGKLYDEFPQIKVHPDLASYEAKKSDLLKEISDLTSEKYRLSKEKEEIVSWFNQEGVTLKNIVHAIEGKTFFLVGKINQMMPAPPVDFSKKSLTYHSSYKEFTLLSLKARCWKNEDSEDYHSAVTWDWNSHQSYKEIQVFTSLEEAEKYYHEEMIKWSLKTLETFVREGRKISSIDSVELKAYSYLLEHSKVDFKIEQKVLKEKIEHFKVLKSKASLEQGSHSRRAEEYSNSEKRFDSEIEELEKQLLLSKQLNETNK